MLRGFGDGSLDDRPSIEERNQPEGREPSGPSFLDTLGPPAIAFAWRRPLVRAAQLPRSES
jgi:hypothetical protein